MERREGLPARGELVEQRREEAGPARGPLLARTAGRAASRRPRTARRRSCRRHRAARPVDRDRPAVLAGARGPETSGTARPLPTDAWRRLPRGPRVVRVDTAAAAAVLERVLPGGLAEVAAVALHREQRAADGDDVGAVGRGSRPSGGDRRSRCAGSRRRRCRRWRRTTLSRGAPPRLQRVLDGRSPSPRVGPCRTAPSCARRSSPCPADPVHHLDLAAERSWAPRS